jgi:hypothetical protein
MRSATGPANQLNLPEIKSLLNLLQHSIDNLLKSNGNDTFLSVPPTFNNGILPNSLAQQHMPTNCLLPTPQPTNLYWYQTLKPPALDNCGYLQTHPTHPPQQNQTHQTKIQPPPPATNYLPPKLFHPRTHINLNSYATTMQYPRSTYANTLKRNLNNTYMEQQQLPQQQNHQPPLNHASRTTHKTPHHASINNLVPAEAFEIFKLIRAYANNRHSYRLFLNDMETTNHKPSRMNQRMQNIHQLTLGQRLSLDNTEDAISIKARLLENLETSYKYINAYYEKNFLNQDRQLGLRIQNLLKPLTLTEIEQFQTPIITHTLLSVDKRRLGRNFRSLIKDEIFDILFQRPKPLRSLLEIQDIAQQHTNSVRNSSIPLCRQTTAPNLIGTSSPIIVQTAPSTNSAHNSPTKTQSRAPSISSSISSTFSPSKWQQTQTPPPMAQSNSPHDFLCSSISTPNTNIPSSTHSTTPSVNSEPLNIIPSSQPTSPTMDNISTDNENSQHTSLTQQGDSNETMQNKIQPMQNALLQFKHYSTNIQDFVMPSVMPLPSSNPFKFKSKDNFSAQLTEHLNILTHDISNTILITILCNSTTPIDCINTHTLIQPTPPSQFLTSVSKINTFFNCLKNITQPIILEFIFVNNPPANILWHHIYKHAANRIPIIISATQDTLPLIQNSHRISNTSSGHDSALRTLYNVMNRPYFLKPNPHFLFRDNSGTHGD